ncbi:hypothetical protein DQ384_38065 [Sphaerisporangium album]|uniref:Uncharacterized protein n=1 Tax=Sphaerisporangium album TaxID=509200 RepID=A0A367EMU8_9ACTN|nr:hypothetical protein [Sphaerisporangium album]RCG19089.1 hypothetical protein DQ384_38065 [Sphaerisporangium album]
MEDLPPEDEYSALVQAVIRFYALISKICEKLPVPIGLPPMGEDFDSETIVPAVQRARVLIRDMPLEEDTARMLGHVLLDWITAHEIVAMVDEFGPAPWRLDALHYSLDRVSTLAKVVIARLDL